jgi:hypothetical protein
LQIVVSLYDLDRRARQLGQAHKLAARGLVQLGGRIDHQYVYLAVV